MFLSFFKHYFSAGNAHHIHSPAIYQLYEQVISSHQWYYAFDDIAPIREEMARNREKVSVLDLGAGSKYTTTQARKVCDIFGQSVSSERKSQLLFRLVNYFQPLHIVELGTCLGVNTLYLAKARQQGQIYTFEGSPALAEIAEQNFEKLGVKHIQLIVGNIDATLTAQLAKLPRVDFVFFDANHRFEPTLRYFEQCLAYKEAQTVFVFDDIYWSKEMEKAWQTIVAHPSVVCSIDLFYVGLVFFEPKLPKQHFKLYWR